MYGYNMVTLGFFGENWNWKVPLSSAHSFPPFCRYLEIIPNFLLFDWALGFIHTKYYRCHYTSSTLNFKNIERGVKLLTGRNTRCLLCSSTSCLCSTWNRKVLWTGYLRQTPPRIRRPLQQTVRILLECIFVCWCMHPNVSDQVG